MMTRVYFKCHLVASGVRLNPVRLPALFNVRRAHQITVTLRLPTEEEQQTGFRIDDAQCEGEMNFDPNDKVVEALRALSEHRLPEGGKPRSAWSDARAFVDESGNLLENHMAPWEALPEPLQSYLTQSGSELNEAIRAALGVLRWRLGDEGRHQPYSSRGCFFSFDGENWMMAPMRGEVHGWMVGDLRITEEVACDVQRLLDEHEDEPLAHALWREGWDQRHTNRRSALLLGITALEVGVKQFISSRVPEADWLLEEAPTPPITRMLVEYLPKLPALEHGITIRSPLPEVMKTIKRGVEFRNKLAHTGRSTYSYETLQEILLAVRDVLWLLDSNRGMIWAHSHMRQPEVPEG